MQIFKFKARSKEWLALRKKVITATEIAGLVGLHPYKSFNSLKTKETSTGEVADNKYMRAGRILEQGCIVSAAEAGFDVESAAAEGYTTFVLDDSKTIGASLDGYIWDEKLGRCIAECKTINKPEKFFAWLDGDLPTEYLIQLHTQLGCTHTEFGYLIGMLTSIPYSTVIYRVRFNQRIFNILKEQVKLFKEKSLTEVDKSAKLEVQQLLRENIEKVSETWVEPRVTTFKVDL